MNLLFNEIHSGDLARIKQIVSEKGIPADTNWSDYGLLRYALWRGSKEIAKYLLEKGCRVRKTKSTSNTPLHVAVKQGDIEMVQLLLLKGAAVHSANKQLHTPLHFAADLKNIKIIDILLAEVSKSDGAEYVAKGGLESLHIACMRNDFEATEKLLNSGASINAVVDVSSPFWPSYTPLHFAVEFQHFDIAELLLTYNTDITIKDRKNLTALHLAVRLKHSKIVELILKFHNDCSQNPEDDRGLSHFHIACMKSNLQVVENFLRHGVGVNKCVKQECPHWAGYSPLHFAVESGCLKTVELLLKHGADVSLKCKSGLTPLHYATRKEDKKILDVILLAHESLIKNVNPKDSVNFSHFHAACMRNNPKIVEIFLKDGVDIDSKISVEAPIWPSYSPLHFAVANECIKNVELLLKYGADIKTKDVKGLTPLHLAVLFRNESITRTLIKNGADVNEKTKTGMSPLHMAVENGYDKIVKVLLENHADVNSTELLKFSTPLHTATLCKQFNVIDLLIDAGADINARERDGKTAMHTVALRDQKKELDMALVGSYGRAISSLLEAGCDINACDSYGRTPLHMACLYRNLAGAYSLLQHGADINIEDNINKTPFCYCMQVYHNIYYIFQEHIEKLRLINFHVSERNEVCYYKLKDSFKRFKRKWKDVEYEDDFTSKCTDELERMKRTKVDGYSSLYNIIYRDANGMALHTKNDTLKDMIKSAEFDTKFPLYGYIIRLQFKKGLARRVLMGPSKEALEFLIGLSLPDSCSETILKYLSNSELDNLIKVKTVTKKTFLLDKNASCSSTSSD